MPTLADQQQHAAAEGVDPEQGSDARSGVSIGGAKFDGEAPAAADPDAAGGTHSAAQTTGSQVAVLLALLLLWLYPTRSWEEGLLAVMGWEAADVDKRPAMAREAWREAAPAGARLPGVRAALLQRLRVSGTRLQDVLDRLLGTCEKAAAALKLPHVRLLAVQAASR